jgi:hypothetical protein
MLWGVVLAAAGCSARIGSEAAAQCSEGLRVAYEELDYAKAKGFGGTVSYSKAASLLTQAKVQKEFQRYESCTDKVARARLFIVDSQKE